MATVGELATVCKDRSSSDISTTANGPQTQKAYTKKAASQTEAGLVSAQELNALFKCVTTVHVSGVHVAHDVSNVAKVLRVR